MSALTKQFAAQDLCLVYAEKDPRVSSLRVAERLLLRSAVINQWVERNRTQLERYGNISRRVIYSGKRGQPAYEYLLNEDQVTLVIMRSDSKEADDARYEIIMLIRAYRCGEIPQTQITIIADLFDPAPMTVERGEGNVVHVNPTQVAIPVLKPQQAQYDDDEDDAIARAEYWGVGASTMSFRAPDALLLDKWADHDAGRTFPIRCRHDLRGQPFMLWFCCEEGTSDCKSKIMVPNADGLSRVMVCFGKEVPPFHVIERNFRKLGEGDYTPIAIATLQYWFGDDDDGGAGA